MGLPARQGGGLARTLPCGRLTRTSSGRFQMAKVAWVTGAGSGIGEAAALALAEMGMVVVLTGRTKAKLDAVAARKGIAHRVEDGLDRELGVALGQLAKAFGKDGNEVGAGHGGRLENEQARWRWAER
eukprot:gene2038-2541_t